MEVVLNGKAASVAPSTTILDLIASLGFGGRQVVVERNGEPVERERFSEVRLQEGDRLEVVRAVAGG